MPQIPMIPVCYVLKQKRVNVILAWETEIETDFVWFLKERMRDRHNK